ncbi:hypothetical protein BL250_01105 [Erwinia sp. OLTSP20]|uniref:winged helix-turn-helix domain-containing protein n=1 Tax=unclassified Erwinia TaxID=2622719 RepID=UPI000C1A6A3F|nr:MULTISPECIES: crosslink repair DNA glycosylase YcaQ family protein [unclassified Erwinia]PIJ51325.1 hypothetical protein BV501_04640 [Erwinia sp. OAMSP11]PIJ74110.1 hypothetical protein BK416_04930 [Erwinia sp. OLSSP12]PIJ79793.1 hypothetical protein BLD47_12830 [Erwinia sp. OLCASP19]PIJ86073.1 hypothetical protein BLD46_04725 [Erwinia sp. OLMTSP26]PIJ87822.1 hypothetical protein BLD49_04725 [Erwinia sp. OLMDSP33]
MAFSSLTLAEARNLHLMAQGLLRPPAGKARPADLLSAIRRMSLLQIDTIHVVARSPWLVLFSRIGSHPFSWLEQALSEGKLFEYWAHEACFIPAEDYPLLRHRMLNPHALGWKYNHQWMMAHQHDIAALMMHIEQHGPVRSADFATPSENKPGWWSWKPFKRHLENLFSAGELMVVGRHHFQRIYDLRRRVLPDWDDAVHALSEADALAQMLRNSARSLGIFRAEWLADYYRLKRAPLAALLALWQEQGEVKKIEVQRLGSLYLDNALFSALSALPAASHTALLSPFDPVIWDRRRARALFDFDYRLECYTPAAKRRYGYFVLPILHRGALKGRLDARMDRKNACLQIHQIWLEPAVRASARLGEDLQRTLSRFAQWQGASRLDIASQPEALSRYLPSRWQID